MSDNYIILVPRITDYPNRRAKADEIIKWLASRRIIHPEKSDCTLGALGYKVDEGAKAIVLEPEFLRFGGYANGLEVNTDRQIFHGWVNSFQELLCPGCNADINDIEGWQDALGAWTDEQDESYACPKCGHKAPINSFTFVPEIGFSNLGFTFWNWPPFTNEFIREFSERLDCDVVVVYGHI
jgi:DNA-directed RNA polymerase subunit RPC12/RpoP